MSSGTSGSKSSGDALDAAATIRARTKHRLLTVTGNRSPITRDKSSSIGNLEPWTRSHFWLVEGSDYLGGVVCSDSAARIRTGAKELLPARARRVASAGTSSESPFRNRESRFRVAHSVRAWRRFMDCPIMVTTQNRHQATRRVLMRIPSVPHGRQTSCGYL